MGSNFSYFALQLQKINSEIFHDTLVKPVKKQITILKEKADKFDLTLADAVDIALQIIAALTVSIIGLLPIEVAFLSAIIFILYVESVAFELQEDEPVQNDWLHLAVTRCSEEILNENEMISKFLTVVWPR